MFIAETRTFGFQNVFVQAESLSTAALKGKEDVVYWTNSFFSAASAKELLFIFFAGTDDRNRSILIIII